MTTIRQDSAVRSPGVTYQELLDQDSRPVPGVLRTTGRDDVGPVEIPIEWYLSPEIHALEVERIWRRTWQMACREEDIPEVGDTWVYDIAEISIVVVRVTPMQLKAFFNSCLHRGRALRDYPGRVRDLQCPFHGFTWNLDGTLKTIPCQWDFPHIDPASFCLPEVRVSTWGGFVFVNPDLEAEPLESFLGDLSLQFEPWPLAERAKTVHVARVIPANWKLAQEAFMESFHVITTHPELLPALGDANSQYDAFANYSRAITASASPSPHLPATPSSQEILKSFTGGFDDQPPIVEIPNGVPARVAVGEVFRALNRPALGSKVDTLSDAEMIDAIYYTVFPNFHPWAGFGAPITYRFRPHGDNHEQSIMEVMLLTPFPPGERPPAAPVHWLDEGASWLEAPELSFLGPLFNQDLFNLERLTVGLRNNQRGRITLSRYQELKIRHFYELYRHQLELPASARD
jgi:nitrite reductase/ring-hydroxylating ferredoxin subunit